MANQSFQDLLQGGYGLLTKYTAGKLFGSDPASEKDLQAEKINRGKINGTGPVNALAAWFQTPMNWTEQFFGKQSVQADGTVTNSGPSGATWIVAGALLLLGWYLLRKK